jgi:hypothetical protein
VGKPHETMEQQTVGQPMSVTNVITKALMVAAVLAAMDSASGGKLLFIHTMKDLLAKIRST